VVEVAAEGGVCGGLVGKAIAVDPPVVLIAGTKYLVIVEVDEARDGISHNTHQAIAPVALDHLEGELLRTRWDLLPVDLANHLVGQLPCTLLEEAVASHLGTWASETSG
jgi:hypothetical protein